MGRPSRVTVDDRRVLKRLVEVCEWPCGKRFVAMLPLWLPWDEQGHGPYESGQRERLLSLSAATLDRHLTPMRKQAGIRGRSGTKPGSMLREQIPIRSGPWDVTQAGFLEADTVAHCGHSMAGQFAWSLTVTDIHTAWTECRAVWHKQVRQIRNALQDIDSTLPFTIKGFDCDNGSEFLNHTLVTHFQEHADKPTFTRSRPYHKNDNAYVEQKNWTHVRHFFGYMRIDDRKHVDAMNDIYRDVSFILNYFTPTMKLISKERVGSKIRKKFDKPSTPLQRVLDDPSIPDATKAKLLHQFHAINPVHLRYQIRAKLRNFNHTISVT